MNFIEIVGSLFKIGEDKKMETILVKIEGHIATVTINRPKALNALSTQVLTELNTVIDEISANQDVYALILTGAGEKAFVAGADISEMKDKTVKEAAAYGAFGNEVFRKIETLRCPVIAAINGFALGGGCELAMSCDIRLASENAVFGQPEVGLGITPGFGGTQRLARTVGVGIAKEMIYTGRNIKASRAAEIGLVNKVVAPEELLPVAVKMATTIASNAPIAIANSKKAINAGLQVDIDSGIAMEVDEFAACFATEDQTYGMKCFLERTKDKTFANK